jgi:MFS family permease
MNPRARDRSGLGLDGVNFFVAAVQTAFGTFVTVYLVKSQWPPAAIGLALTIGTVSTLISQMPAGAVIDSIRHKRRAVLPGVVGVGVAALLLSATAARPAVYLALAVQGLASSLIGPGIAAISLALVGQAALSERIGRNARFASIGNGLAAGVMGIAGSYLPPVSVFLVAAAMVLPALLSLSLIRAGYGGQPFEEPRHEGTRITREGLKDLFLDRRLVIFAACVVLFFAASAAMGPGLAGQVTRRRPELATLVVAVTILLPQGIVAAISPWIGRQAEILGRRPMLLAGWGIIPLQALAYAALNGPYALVTCYLLNSVSAAIFGVMMTVVAADLTRRTGCFNLALGALGVAIAVGASASTFFGGIAAGLVGGKVTALGFAVVGCCGFLLLWVGMPETQQRRAVGVSP